MNSLSTDLRHALREYGKTPVASSIAVLVLAIALTAFVAILSLYVDATKPHSGFDRGEELATLAIIDIGAGGFGFPHAVIETMAEELSSIEAAAISGGTVTLVGASREETVTGLVSSEFFSGLGARLALGRGFDIEDHAAEAEPVVVLSYAYWQERYGGDSSILGTTLEISRDPNQPYGSFFDRGEPEQESAEFRVIGVMSESLPELAYLEPAIWLPLERVYPLFLGPISSLPRHPGRTFIRRSEGASTAAVINEIKARYESDGRLNVPAGWRIDAIEGIVRYLNPQREARRQLGLFLAGSALLALVAAANMSLFLLARGPGRQRELGIRMAVGASTRRIARQLATEASVLVVLAAVVGLLLSVWFGAYLRSTALFQDAEWRNVTLFDWRVMSVAAAALLVLALLASAAPVLDLKRRGIAASSRSAAARATFAQRTVCAAQVAAAGIFASVAIAFGWYVFPMVFGNPGYETSDRYLVEGPGDVYAGQGEYEVALARRRERIEAIPGVTAIGFGAPVPTWGFNYLLPVSVVNPADPANPTEVRRGAADAEFMDLLGFRMVSGSVPQVADTTGVLVNQTLANLLWGREDVVGEVLTALEGTGEFQLNVTGILENFSFSHPASSVPPVLFVPPTSPVSHRRLVAVVETQLTAAGLRQELEQLIAAGSLEITLRGEVEPLQAMRDEMIARDRARGFLTVATAALVVLLAAFGLYGTQRYLVAAAKREFAIRASVGAGPRSLERLVYSRAFLLALPGVVVGTLLGFIVVAWLRDSFLSREVVPTVVTLAVVIGLASLLLVASLGPARQARKCQPAPLLSAD